MTTVVTMRRPTMATAQRHPPSQGALAWSGEPEASVTRDGPGAMRLQAVREGERIVDFRWDFANAVRTAIQR
jgi:hypothetical protein